MKRQKRMGKELEIAIIYGALCFIQRKPKYYMLLIGRAKNKYSGSAIGITKGQQKIYIDKGQLVKEEQKTTTICRTIYKRRDI